MAARGLPASKGRLAIIAGAGALPHHVAEAARRQGEDPFIIALSREADAEWTGFDHSILAIGDFAAISRTFEAEGIDRVVLSGSVRRRPEWRDIRPTLSTLAKVPSVLRTLMSGGDDAVLRMAMDLIEASGARVIGAQEVVPGLLAEVGPLGARVPTEDDWRDIEAGIAAANALGALDVGQGAVAVGGRVIALEGAEGTDAMLSRVAALKTDGRVSTRRRGVLVKLCKPQQDERADLPSIGPSTIAGAEAAGLAGIAVESGRALILERSRVVKAADRSGLFILGVEREGGRGRR
ncbi:LpxI family protein [Sinorhizobium numidicum]|uniref:LpxI family protein n=1 Tax=Sinorhizobium numidicum TaxID=680248 RepID=A0ABY8CY35_9HYPH|nr:LpxI family protein [Sinorhizobium numidicum]WEX78828.1 LpxI family protein [Sinorhizobium numidicum]WEX82225.1 LpxI family protein [Sinorhizobium numidicum]